MGHAWTVRRKQGSICPLWRRPIACSRCSRRSRTARRRPAPSLPRGSASTCARCAATSSPCGTLGIPVEGERGRGGSYRLTPGYRMPPLMFTAGEAAAVALGLMAARRVGLEADGALAKVRRVLPDGVRLRVESLEQTLGFTREPRRRRRRRRRDAARARRRGAPRAPRACAATPTAEGDASERELSPYGLVAHGGRWYVPAYDHGRDAPRALRADRFGAVRLGGPGPRRPRLRRGRLRHPLARPRPLGPRDRGPPARRRRTPRPPLPADAGRARARGTGTLLRMRADSLDWVAGLLAAPACPSGRPPAELRTAVHALAERLREA